MHYGQNAANGDKIQAIDEEARKPTLTVMLPTCNDGWRLGQQLAAIVPQLRECDQLVCVVQGDPAIPLVLQSCYRRPQDVWEWHQRPMGVCQAYNHCAERSAGQWLIGASGNDEWQPGVVTAWLDAARRWPEAKVMFGHVTPVQRYSWLPETGFVNSQSLPGIWLHEGWKTHGAAAFLRRDAWGKGYIPSLEWMADHYQTFILALRHGCVDLQHHVSHVNFLPGLYSQQHDDPAAYNRAMAAQWAEWCLPEYDDVRPLGMLFQKMTGWFQLKPIPEATEGGAIKDNLHRQVSDGQHGQFGLHRMENVG